MAELLLRSPYTPDQADQLAIKMMRTLFDNRSQELIHILRKDIEKHLPFEDMTEEEKEAREALVSSWCDEQAKTWQRGIAGYFYSWFQGLSHEGNQVNPDEKFPDYLKDLIEEIKMSEPSTILVSYPDYAKLQTRISFQWRGKDPRTSWDVTVDFPSVEEMVDTVKVTLCQRFNLIYTPLPGTAYQGKLTK